MNLYSSEVEQSLLGSLLLDNKNFERTKGLLVSTFFYHEEHGTLYNIIATLLKEGKIASPNTCRILWEQQTKKEAEYLFDLIASVITTDIEGYCGVIKEYYVRRTLKTIGEDLQINAKELPLDTIIPSLEKEIKPLQKLILSKPIELPSVVVENIIQEITDYAQSDETTKGLATGFKALDKAIGGLKKSHLTILAARPSMGKTALALNIATHTARHYHVLFFSVEMTARQLMIRILSQQSRIPSFAIENEKLSDNQIAILKRVEPKLFPFIDDTCTTIQQIETTIQSIHQTRPIDLVIIDYLQLLGDKNNQNRTMEITNISNNLKTLSKELNIAVLALSQLSRNLDSRADKRPLLSDLRDSGAIEQDADVVTFLYRDEYYNKNQDANKHKAELIIAKNRSGETKTINLLFNGRLTEFTEPY